MKLFKRIIKNVIRLLGYEIVRITNSQTKEAHNNYGYDSGYAAGLSFRHFLQAYLSSNLSENFFFIQIGANDGRTGDPLYDFVVEYDMKGLLIEPQKAVFEKLKENYKGNKNLCFANVAISNDDSQKEIYIVRESFQPIYNRHIKRNATGIASFDKNHIRRNLRKNMPEYFNGDNDVDDYIETQRVEVISFELLLRQHGISEFNMLQIDTEGYDFEIIKMIDFTRFRPRLINYEHKNLTLEDRRECERLLNRNGYNLFIHGGDTCAFL